MKETQTYHDPEDCPKTSGMEHFLDHADYLRDERKDKEMEAAMDRANKKTLAAFMLLNPTEQSTKFVIDAIVEKMEREEITNEVFRL